MEFLLAVDLGVKTGFAMYSSRPELLWYHSQNYGNKFRLKKAIPGILNQDDRIDYLVMEGGGSLQKIWDASLEKMNIEVIHIMAEAWRKVLLLDREQRKGKMAKDKALMYALKIIDRLSEKKTASLNVNAAEAIMIGLWGINKLGWIKNPDHILR
jgi:hypothetical protein